MNGGPNCIQVIEKEGHIEMRVEQVSAKSPNGPLCRESLPCPSSPLAATQPDIACSEGLWEAGDGIVYLLSSTLSIRPAFPPLPGPAPSSPAFPVGRRCFVLSCDSVLAVGLPYPY
jgi:hypothetical protein